MDQMCFECDADDASLSSEVRTLLLCVAIIVVILLAFTAHRLYRGYAERGEIKDAGQMRWVKPSFTAGGSAPLKIYAKICISHYQILTQFRESLGSMANVWTCLLQPLISFVLCAAVLFDIAFPAVFQSWLDVLSVLSLDLYTFIGELPVPTCTATANSSTTAVLQIVAADQLGPPVPES
jgi:hypothetical protein